MAKRRENKIISGIKNQVSLSAPKGYSIRNIEVQSNIPNGYTTFKIRLKKGKLNIPFPKTRIVKGTGYVRKFSAFDNSMKEIIVYEQRRKESRRKN